MTSFISRWSEALAAVSFHAETRDRFDLAVAPAYYCGLDLERARAGTWWILPFAASRAGDVYGLRLLPGRPPAACPVVTLRDAEAITIASRPAHFIPALVLERLRDRDPRGFNAAIPEAAWREVILLHSALGGAGDLRELRALVQDGRIREALRDDSRRRRFLFDARRWLDPSPETEVYLGYLLAAVARDEAPVPLPEAGGWNAALASLAFVTNRQERFQGANVTAEISAAWSMVKHPPGLDTARSSFPDDRMRLDGTRSRTISLAAAESLQRHQDRVPSAWRADPLWPAIVALAEAGSGYDGEAHRRCAADLALAGRPDRALVTLAGAAFWSYARHGTSSPAALDDARRLAQAERWTDLAEWLDHLSTLQSPATAGSSGGKRPILVRGPEDLFDSPGTADRFANVVEYAAGWPEPPAGDSPGTAAPGS